MPAIAVFVLALLATVAAPHRAALAQENLKRHVALVGDRRPALCATKDAVALVVGVIERAADARAKGEADKAKSLYEIAARLQGEICDRPGPDDAVIVRCDLGRRTVAGGAVSLLKVTAVKRSEIAKGEQSFYAWSYLPVVTDAANVAESAALDKRWCSDEASDRPVAMTPDRILQVQSRFYDLGIQAGALNGELSPDTVRAITLLQRHFDLPATGELTELTLARLNGLPAPSPWVAMAFDGEGNFGSATGSATRRAAEAEAIAKLRRRSRSDYRLTTAPAPSCIAIATTTYDGRSNGRRTRFTQAFTNISPTEAEARTNVLAYCNQQKTGGTCRYKDTICSAGATGPRDGSQPQNNPGPVPRFDPKDPLTINSRPPVSAGAPPSFTPRQGDEPLSINGLKR